MTAVARILVKGKETVSGSLLEPANKSEKQRLSQVLFWRPLAVRSKERTSNDLVSACVIVVEALCDSSETKRIDGRM